jgi:hypothetical protein
MYTSLSAAKRITLYSFFKKIFLYLSSVVNEKQSILENFIFFKQRLGPNLLNQTTTVGLYDNV